MSTPRDQAPEGEQTSAGETDEPVLHEFLATAYCLRGITSSGTQVNAGSVAADPDVLPIGSVIRMHAGAYSGIYTVLDTGAKVRGRRLDVWFPNYEDAIEFGVRKVKVEIIRYGWEPTETEADSL
jgi:3D (Asp-Asp-Asp) domain-containing protein